MARTTANPPGATGVAEPPKATGEDVEEVVISEKDETGTKKKFIRYTGEATERIITASDWESLGIEGKEASVWTLSADLKLPSEDFDGKQLGYLLKVDGRFKAVDK